MSGPIEELIAEAKAAAGSLDVYLDGGGLVRQALDAGLLDELTLTYVPVLLAGGIPLFNGLQRRCRVEIVEQHRHGAGMLQVVLRAGPERITTP